MGSSIYSYFPRALELDPATIERALRTSFGRLEAPLAELRLKGHFSDNTGAWSVKWYDDDPNTRRAFSDGPHGFLFDAYEKVLSLGSVERSWSIYAADSPIARPLRQILCAVARDLGAAPEIVIACSVNGQTDFANDLAFAGGSFDDICACMREHAGLPATTWKEWEAGEKGWYLGPAV